jgi:diadenosine tetraphosphate (Ap4A) HIT family hydrolase
MNCPLCQRVELASAGQYPYLIHEFDNSFLMLGEHQFYQGYCVLVLKPHYREMTDLDPSLQAALFKEMMSATKAIQDAFKPHKMNMCSLGNVVEHIHWHFFPRYQDDPDFKNPPWLQMHSFDQAKVSPSEALENIQKIKSRLITEK